MCFNTRRMLLSPSEISNRQYEIPRDSFCTRPATTLHGINPLGKLSRLGATVSLISRYIQLTETHPWRSVTGSSVTLEFQSRLPGDLLNNPAFVS